MYAVNSAKFSHEISAVYVVVCVFFLHEVSALSAWYSV